MYWMRRGHSPGATPTNCTFPTRLMRYCYCPESQPTLKELEMKLRLIALSVVAAAALAVAGCGGADDSTDGSGSSGGSGSTSLALVAFSTPEVVYNELIPDFQKTSAGKDV